jgi:uncharacterized protein (DUF1015 family)
MAEIYPFRAMRYNPDAVPDLSKAVTQPYDKISPEFQARYYDAHPANLVRLILRRRDSGNIYQAAARDFREWIDAGTLISEREPCLYAYAQTYTVPGRAGEKRRRWGFIALLRIEDYSAREVHRHEETLSGPKADRLELLKATRANFGQIFMLYSDPAGALERLLSAPESAAAWERATDDYGFEHKAWRVSDPRTIERAVEAMREKKLVIADGHHRYETSLAYRDLRRAESAGDDRAEYVMATFVPMESSGLIVLPTHRVVHSLPGFEWEKFAGAARQFFEWEDAGSSASASDPAGALAARLEESGRARPTLLAYAGPGRAALLSPRADAQLDALLPDLTEGLRRLDVVLLHRLVLERVLGIDRQAVREQKNLRYVREAEAAIVQVASGEAQVAFLMNPTPVAAVRDNALAGSVLPQKSTDFFPKLLSGLTIYWMDNPAGL